MRRKERGKEYYSREKGEDGGSGREGEGKREGGSKKDESKESEKE